MKTPVRVFLSALAWLSLLAATRATAGAGEIWLTVTRTGAAADGSSAFDRFELTPDGLARWQTSAFGMSSDPLCNSEGGSFEGKAGGEQAARLARAARAALESQPKDREHRRSHRAVTLSVHLDADGESRSGRLTTATPEYDGLLKEINALETTLRPRSLVIMKASSKGARVTVSFFLAGDRPQPVVLPDEPADAFKIEGLRLRYGAKQSPPDEIVLTPGKRRYELTLIASSAPPPGARLRYSNAAILHHAAGDALAGDATPPELALCAPITP